MMPKASKIHLEGETDGVEGGKVPDELSGAPALYEQEVGILDGESGLAAEVIRKNENKINLTGEGNTNILMAMFSPVLVEMSATH